MLTMHNQLRGVFNPIGLEMEKQAKEKGGHMRLKRQEKGMYEKRFVRNITSQVQEAHGGETCLAGVRRVRVKPPWRGPREAEGGWPLALHDATMPRCHDDPRSSGG